MEVWLEDRNKERDHLTEDISEKNKEIEELNELVQLLKNQLKKYEKTASHEDKVNTSINSEEEEEDI